MKIHCDHMEKFQSLLKSLSIMIAVSNNFFLIEGNGFTTTLETGKRSLLFPFS